MFNTRVIFIVIFSFGFIVTYAQFGLRLKTNINKYSNINGYIQDSYEDNLKFHPRSYEVGLDYWFRLKKRRVEFLPEFSVSLSKSETNLDPSFNSKMVVYGFGFHTQIYALDMEGDCNCPTFSKQGPSINKGLFFHFTPKVALLSEKTSILSEDQTQQKWILGAGVGLGLDVGVSDLLTITPILTYALFSSYESNVAPGVTDNPSQIQLSLRFGFRPDYNHRRR
ncbi:MAG: hypothetical protein R2774_14385 [Saprospiraceae bacterium]